MRKRAKFNLSNFHNCTFKMGQLYPVHLQEVLPGDTIQMSQSIFMRLAPMVAPVMHPTYMFCHTFYVPSRVIANFINNWEDRYSGVQSQAFFDFESFITGGPSGEDAQVFPTVSVTSINAPSGSLLDAFGLPVQNLSASGSFAVNALPIAAYYLIYDEYYRDQDLQRRYGLTYNQDTWVLASLGATDDGPASYEPSFSLLQPCWSKDYFTTARPWPQKGPQVTIPVQAAGGGITGNVNVTISADPNNPMQFVPPLDINPSGVTPGPLYSEPEGGESSINQVEFGGVGKGNLSYASGLAASATFTSTTPGGIGSIDLSDFREAMALQRFEEHRSLFGSRYEDYLRYLGVRPQDARLQLPEYLGGFTAPVQFSEVLQTSAGDTGGVGDLYGHGISAARGRRIRRFIPEHGYIMSIMCVRPIPVYSQGIERLWSKKTKEDFWQRELEHIGQQEILNSEVYADGTSDDANTFGFQNRYDEYRRGVNIVTGEFRTNQDFWTLARIFDNRPALNSDFVECNPSDRIFQVGEQNSDQLYCMVKNNVIAKRLVSKNGNPI